MLRWLRLLLGILLLTAVASPLVYAQDESEPEAALTPEQRARQAQLELWLRPWEASLPPTVRDIHFEEQKQLFRVVRGTNDNNLRVAMYQQEAGWGAHVFFFRRRVERPVLDPAVLQEDAWRLELWYANHGYFDAEVSAWELRPYRSRWRPEWLDFPRFRAPSVQVVGHVNEGEVSVVSEVSIEGIEELGRAFRIKLDRSIGDITGDPFDMATARSLRALVVELLKEQSYARATATLEVIARPEDLEVDIRVVASPGQPCVFGEVDVEGNVAVPEGLIREAITVKPGRAYAPQTLKATQSALFNLGTFSLVQVIPDTSVEGQVIPVKVVVQESKFRRLRVGGGVAKQPSEAQVRARAEFTHTNLGGRLIHLNTSATGGYKVFSQGGAFGVSDLGQAIQEGSDRSEVLNVAGSGFGAGPFFDVESELAWPQFFGVRKLRVHPMVGGELGIDIGQTYRFIEVSPAFTWSFSPRFSITPSYHFEWWDTDLQFVDSSRVGLGTRDNFNRYTLHYLRLQAVYDRRDDKIYPQSGYYGSIGLTDAGAPIFPGFTFARVDFDMRRYFRVVRPLRSVAAVRLAGGLAQPYSIGGSDPELAAVPYNDLFFLGGLDTVRGFTRDLLGPRVCTRINPDTDVERFAPCDANRDSPGASDINIYPAGAQAVLWGTLEYRISGPFSIDYAVFTDLGFAWATLDDMVADPLAPFQPVVGAGFRYRSPVGPLRVDFGWRVKEPAGDYSLDRRWGVHLALQEAF